MLPGSGHSVVRLCTQEAQDRDHCAQFLFQTLIGGPERGRAEKVVSRAVPALVVGLAWSFSAQAASFDCAAASTADEQAVCANAQLSALDSEMAGLWYGYKAMPLLMGASGNREDEAQVFLKARSDCGSDTKCLTKLYESRIATLQKNITWAVKNYCNTQN